MLFTCVPEAAYPGQDRPERPVVPADPPVTGDHGEQLRRACAWRPMRPFCGRCITWTRTRASSPVSGPTRTREPNCANRQRDLLIEPEEPHTPPPPCLQRHVTCRRESHPRTPANTVQERGSRRRGPRRDQPGNQLRRSRAARGPRDPPRPARRPCARRACGTGRHARYLAELATVSSASTVRRRCSTRLPPTSGRQSFPGRPASAAGRRSTHQADPGAVRCRPLRPDARTHASQTHSGPGRRRPPHEPRSSHGTACQRVSSPPRWGLQVATSISRSPGPGRPGPDDPIRVPERIHAGRHERRHRDKPQRAGPIER